MIDIERIKRYNEALDNYKAEANRVLMEKELIDRDIDRLCKELSDELHTPVTRENAESLCSEYMEKLENTLTTGEEIFERVKAEAEYAGGIYND